MGEWPDEMDNIDKDDNGTACIQFFGEEGGMKFHPAGSNILFADGHVAAFRKYDPQAITYHPTQRMNWGEVVGNQP